MVLNLAKISPNSNAATFLSTNDDIVKFVAAKNSSSIETTNFLLNNFPTVVDTNPTNNSTSSLLYRNLLLMNNNIINTAMNGSNGVLLNGNGAAESLCIPTSTSKDLVANNANDVDSKTEVGRN